MSTGKLYLHLTGEDQTNIQLLWLDAEERKRRHTVDMVILVLMKYIILAIAQGSFYFSFFWCSTCFITNNDNF